MNYKIFSNNYNSQTGLGKQTISLKNQLKYPLYLKKTYDDLSKIKNRNIFNICYFIVSSFISIGNKDKIISMSVVSPLNSHAVHFSSCHLYALKNIYKYFFFRLFLNPLNIFYTFLEFLHYKNKNSINIFLSNIEKQRFESVYGSSQASYKVIRPKLVDNFYNFKKEKFINGKQFIISSHNLKLKGGETINNLAKCFPQCTFTIIGDKKNAIKLENIVTLGDQNISSFSFEKYNIFIYPSKLDSHSFSLEEAFINGLIPITSNKVGFSEFIGKYKLINKYLIHKSNSWDIFLNEFLNINDHKLNLLRNELAKARADWLKRDIKNEYFNKGITV